MATRFTLKYSVIGAVSWIIRPLLRSWADLSLRLQGLLEILPFILSSKAVDFVIVTGADSSHYRSLCQFLASLRRYEPDVRTIMFDLGLAEAERQELSKSFPWINLRRFEFASYPDYFNIKVNAGEYAWKPVIVADILTEFKGCVCWMDAGNLIVKPLTVVRRVTKARGLYSPISSGTISDWTHPGTLEFLNAPDAILNKHNLSGYCVAVNYANEKARTVVKRWKEGALIRECIAPEGSSRKNHRQDQAVLSVLTHMAGLAEGMPKLRHGFECHQDVD